jgi:hypothetical protein
MEFLIERRQTLNKDPDLLTTRGYLEHEAASNAGEPPFDPYKMRQLPGFLEPIGIYLRYNPSRFPEAYQVFAREVHLCAGSKYLWTGDDYRTSPYWVAFKDFVDDTKAKGLR